MKLNIFGRGHVKRGNGSETQTSGFRRETTGTEDLAALVRSGRKHRQPLGNAGLCGSFFRNRTHHFGRFDQARKLFFFHLEDSPLKIELARPLVGLIVKRQITDIVTRRIDKFAGEPMRKKSGQHQIFMRFFPDVRLVLTDPVRLAFLNDVLQRIQEVDCFQKRTKRRR